MMKKIFQWLKSNPYALLSGVLIGTSYMPFPPWAILFCYAPLWLSVLDPKKTWKDAFWMGWLTQFVLSLIGFHWIAHTASEFGQLPGPVALLALVLFAALMHLYIPASVALTKFAQKRFALSDLSTLLLAALSLGLLERIWPVIFEWHLGYTWFGAQLPAYHWADTIGFSGLSTLTLLANAWIGYIWLMQSNGRKALLQAAIFIFIVAAVNLSGAWRAKNLPTPNKTIKVSLIQANIGNLEKVYAEKGQGYISTITDKFMRLSQAEVQKHPDTELLVWPETGFPEYLGNENLNRRHVQYLLKDLAPLGKSLLTGAYYKKFASDGAGTSTYNALFLIKPTGESWSEPYLKTHLLVFGEYFPLSERFPIILKLLPFISNFGRGTGPSTMELGRPDDTVKFGGQICYESLYPAFTRGLAERGAEVLINVTNDSWFGLNFEPQQHMTMTLARAVEVRRPLLRSTNTGISTVVLASGKVLKKSPLHTEWSDTYEVPFVSSPEATWYTRWGHLDWVLWTLMALALLMKGYANAKSRNA